MNKKGFIVIIAVLVIVGLIILAIVWFYNNYQWNKIEKSANNEFVQIS